jgi:aryl-alcohol dehydrogenase-like predicted oxidoreductase
MQNHYNLIYREEEREMIPLCRDRGTGVIPWSPLARGLLTGSRHRDGVPRTPRAAADDYARQLYTTNDFDIIDTLTAVATERALPPAQLALAWLLTKPGVTAPIIGATATHHVDNAVAALNVALTDIQRERLEAPYQPRAIRGHE